MEIRLPSAEEWQKVKDSYVGVRLLSIGAVLLFLLHWKSDLEEIVSTANQLPSFVRGVGTLLGSPWAGLTLVVFGIAYIIFVPAKNHPSSRAAVTAIAWMGGVISFAALVVFVALLLAVHIRPLESEYTWSPLTGSQKEQVRSAFKDLGEHNVTIVRCETTDCQILADGLNDFARGPTPVLLTGFDMPGITIYYDAGTERAKVEGLRTGISHALRCRVDVVKYTVSARSNRIVLSIGSKKIPKFLYKDVNLNSGKKV